MALPPMHNYTNFFALLICSSAPRLAKVVCNCRVVTGRKVNACAASNGIPTTMELGGKSALLVFDDADVEKAVEWCMVSHATTCLGFPRLTYLLAHSLKEALAHFLVPSLAPTLAFVQPSKCSLTL